MNETIASLLRSSCQSQVDLFSTLVSGLRVNRDVALLLASIGQQPPSAPDAMDRMIGLAQDQLAAAKDQQAVAEARIVG